MDCASSSLIATCWTACRRRSAAHHSPRGLGVVLAFLVSCLLPGCAGAAPESVTVVRRAHTPAGDVAPTELTAWYPIMNRHEWPGDMLLEAALIAEQPVRLVVTGHNIVESDYLQELLAAAAAGRAPDVAYISSSGDLGNAVRAEVVAPLSDCRAAHPSFAHIREIAWIGATGRGETWAMPVVITMHVLFYNKQKLRALGWSTTEIESLPARIEAGTFTLSDLRDTAAEALAAGVIKPGYGLSQRPSGTTRIIYYYGAFGGRVQDAAGERLVIDRAALARAYAFRQGLLVDDLTAPFVLDGAQNTWSARLLWHDAMAHGAALFWTGLLTDWEKWEAIAAGPDLAPPQTVPLSEQVGLTFVPSATAGQPGRVETDAGYFVILNEEATGRHNQRAACALLAGVARPTVNRPPLAGSGWLPVVSEETATTASVGQETVDAAHPLVEAEALIERALVLRNFIDHDARFYQDTLAEFAQRVQSGQMTPDEAAAAAARQLRLSLGDDLIVE